MSHTELSRPQYVKENVRQLRMYLKMTQKEFLEYFLTDSEGKKMMSTATLSNLESKGGERIVEVTERVCDRLPLDSDRFELEPSQFLPRLESALADHEDVEKIYRSKGDKKGNINQLLNQLTMYFAEEIYAGRLSRGDQIASDRELARNLGVGRSAVREALKVLDVLGMIEIRPGQGTYITNRETNFFSVPLAWSLFMDGGQIEDILMIRNTLEEKSAELAADCTDEKLLRKLENTVDRMKQAYEEKNYQKFLNEDLNFHGCIAECSGNSIIFLMIQTIRSLVRRVCRHAPVEYAEIDQIHREHLAVYEAVLRRDAAAAKAAMQQHMITAANRYEY